MSITLPGPTLGVVGGGQLGRMLAEAAAPLGVDVIVLDPTPSCPASTVARGQVVAEFDDQDAIEDLASRVDALTYEIELADPTALAAAGDAHDVPVHPTPETLETIQDKLVQTEALADAGIPVPEFAAVATADGLKHVVEAFDGVMLKARRGGYDGRGNVPVEDPSEAAAALEAVGGDAMAERLVDFEREIAVMGLKGASGETRTYPATETIHRDEILRESVTPARTTDERLQRAQSVAEDVLAFLDGRGVYGIELFETREGEILVNEIAPRPHNSGHWTIEGAATSQFENHVRAVLGWPLGPTDLVGPAVTANVLGDVTASQTLDGDTALRGVGDVLEEPSAALHWYGKATVRPLRKMGHVTVTEDASTGPADDASERALSRAQALRDGLTFKSA